MVNILNKTRFDKIDIIKGLGIILMVCGHCNAPFTGWLYMFHMPIFFIASGYCWNSRNSQDFSSMVNYIWRKIKSLYIPYVTVNSIFALLQNFFIKINIYSGSTDFAARAGQGAMYGLFLEEPFYDTLMSVKNCFVLNSSEQLGGATWFVGTLILISILHCIYEYLVNAVKLSKFKNSILIRTILIAFVFAEIIDEGRVSLPFFQVTHPFFAGYTSYLMGMFLRQLEPYRPNVNALFKVFTAVITGMAIKSLMVYGGIGSGSGIIQNPLYYTTVSLLGWFCMESVADLMTGNLRSAVIYIGKNTLPVVFFHFLAFKPVSLAFILATGMEMYMLASFPVIFDLPWFMWIVYTVAGIALPLGANYIYQNFKSRLFNK